MLFIYFTIDLIDPNSIHYDAILINESPFSLSKIETLKRGNGVVRTSQTTVPFTMASENDDRREGAQGGGRGRRAG